MDQVDVTDRVWRRLLEVRGGTAELTGGEWSPGEQRALELYGPLARRDRGPLTVGQIGQSLDGRVATVADDARDISGPDGLAHLHRMRALSDGVIVGVKTALHDEPRLTVRLCEGPSPARIVIDPHGRLPNDAPIFHPDGTRRLVIQAVDQLRPDGVEVIRLAASDGRVEPADILAALQREGFHTLLVEGGGFTISRFIDAGLLDRLHIAIAPVLIGAGQQGITMPSPPDTLAEAMRPTTTAFSVGSDVVFDCELPR
ncbi:RibD family protein [Pontimonas sp.]|uniref:RibD family protein n=2 Tax=Pontimonas sp. TaxID=2304492 RepID=UPI00286FB09A|nr:RibD family protein [Pontimonas sp.]MDR9395998.1 RibD family protein [Pontimonas sp.]